MDRSLVAKPDWDNDFQDVVRGLQSALHQAADDKAKGVILRRIKRALSGDDTPALPASNERRRR